MFALGVFEPLKSPQQAESGLEIKWLEDFEGLEWDGKGLAEVDRRMEEAGVLKGDM